MRVFDLPFQNSRDNQRRFYIVETKRHVYWVPSDDDVFNIVMREIRASLKGTPTLRPMSPSIHAFLARETPMGKRIMPPTYRYERCMMYVTSNPKAIARIKKFIPPLLWDDGTPSGVEVMEKPATPKKRKSS